MNTVKLASAVLALLVALSGGLWALDHTYCRYEAFAQHEQKHIKAEIFQNQKLIWEYTDRIKKHPEERPQLEPRIRELEFQNQLLMEQLKKRA